MQPHRRIHRAHLQLLSKSAFIRLAILFVALSLATLWAWFAMFAMPGKSYQGELPSLQSSERALQSALEADVRQLAVEIGPRNLNTYEQLNAAKDV